MMLNNLRFINAGESHGKAQIGILEGMPSGLSISENEIQKDLEKRKTGAGRGDRGKIEKDKIKILSGVRFGKTIGSPITLYVENNDYMNWKEKMSIKNASRNYQQTIQVTKPRPGHADLAGIQKYGFKDIRNVLERSSARETVTRVAAGAICRKMLKTMKIEVASHTIRIGKIMLNLNNYDFARVKKSFSLDPITRCIDSKTASLMKKAIKSAKKNCNTLGGIIEIIAKGCPPGLGSYVHYDRKIDAKIAASIISIQSVKAIEIGQGIASTAITGLEYHDRISIKRGIIKRETNNAGGIEGGMTNGENIIIRMYLKPISTMKNRLKSVDINTKKEVKAHFERSDSCVVPRAGIIGESMICLILADLLLQKFGQDNIRKIINRVTTYKKSIVT